MNNDVVNRLCDTLDELTMTYYAEKGGPYLAAMTNVLEKYYKSNKQKKSFDALSNILNSDKPSFEEVRKAFLLLDIKGYKHSNISLDEITPDTIGILFTHLISFLRRNDEPIIYDIGVGSGNLSFIIHHFLPFGCHQKGIEISSLLSYYVKAKAQLVDFGLEIYNQDALKSYLFDADIVVGDLSTYEYEQPINNSLLQQKGVTNFPFLLIEQLLKKTKDETSFVFLMDSDFTIQKDADKFHSCLNSLARIACFIVLPPSLFKQKSKVLMVITKKTTVETAVYILPSFSEQTQFKEVITRIKQTLEEI